MKYIFVIKGDTHHEAARQELSRRLQTVEEELLSRGDTYEIYVTKGVGDGARYTRIYCDLHPAEKVCFVACGHDGMVNEVASGLVGFEKKLMALQTFEGDNCDFARYYPQYDFSDIRAVFQSQAEPIDILRINDSYSLNVCDFGFDSIVGEVAAMRIERGKKKPFETGILWALLLGRFNQITVIADGERLCRWLLLGTLANGSHVGNGFKCAPRAQNNDGIIDVCCIKIMTLLRFFLIMSIYKRGEHLDKKSFARKLVYRRARHVEITSSFPISLCLDGEMLPGTQFTVDILPKAINFCLPKREETVNGER